MALPSNLKNTAAEQAAQLLLRCRRKHVSILKLPDTCAPASLDDADRIQQSLTQSLDEPRADYKVGSTNETAQCADCHHEPIVELVYRNCVFADGASLSPIHGSGHKHVHSLNFSAHNISQPSFSSQPNRKAFP